MRHFNYKEVFEKFFPYYYKENDSYKDKEGKGLLERLVTTCTEYIDTDIVTNSDNPGLDDLINILDFDKTPDIFLNYLWEYLGEIPYAWGILTNGQPYTKENLQAWLTSPTSYPRADPRIALKYAISLYKIRGTTKFYSLLGKLYGVKFDLVDHATGGHILEGDFVKATFSDSYATYASDEDPEGIASKFPMYDYPGKEKCLECVQVEIHVHILEGTYKALEMSDEIYVSNVKQAFQRIVEKYLPIFCKVYYDENGEASVSLESYALTLIVR